MMNMPMMEHMLINGGDTRKGSQLGVTYTKDATEFNIWAPAATGVKVNIYEAGAGNASNACKIGSYTEGV